MRNHAEHRRHPPGQPIQVKDICFLSPLSADTRPPELMANFQPVSDLVIVIGRRFETQSSRPETAGAPSPSDAPDAAATADGTDMPAIGAAAGSFWSIGVAGVAGTVTVRARLGAADENSRNGKKGSTRCYCDCGLRCIQVASKPAAAVSRRAKLGWSWRLGAAESAASRLAGPQFPAFSLRQLEPSIDGIRIKPFAFISDPNSQDGSWQFLSQFPKAYRIKMLACLNDGEEAVQRQSVSVPALQVLARLESNERVRDYVGLKKARSAKTSTSSRLRAEPTTTNAHQQSRARCVSK